MSAIISSSFSDESLSSRQETGKKNIMKNRTLVLAAMGAVLLSCGAAFAFTRSDPLQDKASDFISGNPVGNLVDIHSTNFSSHAEGIRKEGEAKQGTLSPLSTGGSASWFCEDDDCGDAPATPPLFYSVRSTRSVSSAPAPRDAGGEFFSALREATSTVRDNLTQDLAPKDFPGLDCFRLRPSKNSQGGSPGSGSSPAPSGQEFSMRCPERGMEDDAADEKRCPPSAKKVAWSILGVFFFLVLAIVIRRNEILEGALMDGFVKMLANLLVDNIKCAVLQS